jgi:holo-[acyl-carrier protein] synthase
VIIGIGIDVVPVERFAQSLIRTPALATRLFTDSERVTASGAARSPESLAARFAAKEAIAKALGAPGGMLWHDAEISTDDRGRPHLSVTGTVAARADALGIKHWHISLSHDGGMAAATVVAEG